MQEKILGMRRSLAVVSQRLQAPKTWVGTEGINVVQVIGYLLDLVQDMNSQLAGHTHGTTPTPGNAAAFTADAAKAARLAVTLKSITLSATLKYIS